MSFLYYKAINWNETEDALDQYTWEKLTTNFWLDIRVPVFEDRETWDKLTTEKQRTIGNLLASASLNTALQAEIGAPSLRSGIQTQQEEAVLNITTFMESVHTKAFTTIYRALVDEKQTEDYYNFADTSHLLTQKYTLIEDIFATGNPMEKKVAFIFLETALSFGEYAPVLTEPLLMQTNQMIQNMLRGTGIYVAYLGYKFQQAFRLLNDLEKTKLTNWMDDFFNDMLTIQTNFFKKEVEGISASALNLMYFGANYTLTSLGFEPRFQVTLPSNIQPLLYSLLTTTKQLAQQSQVSLNSQQEEMVNDDYTF